MLRTCDYLIIGSGVIGLSIARRIKEKFPEASIIILDKEGHEAEHASGRNSGILHAGFYYTADSMKARFTVEGNRAWKEYCAKKNIPVNICGKLVIAQDEQELATLYELEKRGRRNGSDVKIIDAAEAEEIEPNVKTFKKALYSPATASIDPKQACRALREDLRDSGAQFSFNTRYLRVRKDTVETTQGDYRFRALINCAGLHADTIAHDFGFGRKYTMIPFKGLYLKYTKNNTDIKTNIYPVPNLKNPFLGVHFTKTVGGDIKIGPTAIPAFWRENYQGWTRFKLKEFFEIIYHEKLMFLTNASGFRDLALEEVRKYNKTYLIALAAKMVKSIDPEGFTEFTRPGIRAQLLDKESLGLVQDFVVEGDRTSVHILNAVSPAFTCAFPFARHVVDTFVQIDK